MKLTFNDNFELEIGNDGTTVLKGTFRELSKQEKKQFKELTKDLQDKQKQYNKIARKVQRLNNDIQILNATNQQDAILKYFENISQGKEVAKSAFDEVRESRENLKTLQKKSDELFALDDEAKELLEQIEDIDLDDDYSKFTIEKCVTTEQVDLLNKCINLAGYKKVLKAIAEAVAEGKK